MDAYAYTPLSQHDEHSKLYSMLMDCFQRSELVVLHRSFDSRLLPWLHMKVLEPSDDCSTAVLAVYQPSYPFPPCKCHVSECTSDELIITGKMIYEIETILTSSR